MKMVVLVENSSRCRLCAEHGLSVYIEYEGKTYLLDTGATALFAENAKKHVLPPITANSDESKELANIMSQIEIYRDESIVAFITGATSLDEFDNFVKEINNMGIEKAIEIKKAGLARYNAR